MSRRAWDTTVLRQLEEAIGTAWTKVGDVVLPVDLLEARSQLNAVFEAVTAARELIPECFDRAAAAEARSPGRRKRVSRPRQNAPATRSARPPAPPACREGLAP